MHHTPRQSPDAFRRLPSIPLPRFFAMLGACLAFAFLPACRLLVGTTAVAVGAVGVVGYGVYKTGEAAVTGVGSAVSSASKGVSSAVFFKGEFKASCNGTVEAVWLASASVLKSNGFRLRSGNRDARSGHLEAATWDDEAITVKLDDAGQGQTEFRMRIGTQGNLKQSETLFQLVSAELARQDVARMRGGT